jgi:hypothetical protein
MKKLVILAVLVLAASFIGCQQIEDHSGTAESVVEKVDQYAPIADKVTGGWASTIAGIAVPIVTSIIAVNRGLLAHKRKKVIVEANESSNSPPILSQVKTPEAKSTAEKILG